MVQHAAAPSVRLRALGALIVLLTCAGAVLAFHDHWPELTASLRRFGAPELVGGTLAGGLSLLAAWRAWRAVLDGLHPEPSHAGSARVFFVSQLGKYAPGSVWPILFQAHAGRRAGVPAGSMVTANLLSTVVNLLSGLLVAVGCLAVTDTSALAHFWPVLVVVPLLASLLAPGVLTRVAATAYRALRREPPDLRLAGGVRSRALGWSLAMWAALGAQTALLVDALSSDHADIALVSVGGTALAVCLGVLFLPAPAGAGIREVALGLALAGSLPTPSVLAVVAASRALAFLCDVLAAAIAQGTHLVRSRLGAAPDAVS